MKRILIVSAHPDDDILGCGAYLYKYRNELEFRVVFIAEGSTCRFDFDRIQSKEALEQIEIRTASAIKSLNVLGVKNFKFYDLPCGRLDQIPIIDINKIIENEIRTFKPDTIMVHSETDVNNDHRIVARSLEMAARPVWQDCDVNIVSFEVLSTTEWNLSGPFTPNLFEEISEECLRKKWEALECYYTEIKEFPYPRSYVGLETLAKYRGMQSGFKFAESFKIIRWKNRITV
ncbi:PIG-L family deacetylase [Leptospira yasudae]|uniref:PIG-L family deacetylase n=1 Tax=Leptospira yasudae TaxID=2202201 RepID=A0ABX9M048_9LEPT|nr:PIG-L family deacetylase [Leptospira yasudae]RHX78270.1 PIG-L family deacetylase [Leptospira yasudae]TGK24517.1 PIG-L family deacetylase [Leptospira yasudae]TGM05697.1 PIG-L family deacetylase [Leptospira yasudae]